MFVNTFWSLVPPIVAIGLALLTKETYSSLFIGIVVGALLATDFSPIGALDTIINDGLTAAIADNAGIFLFLVILGVMVALVNATGGSAAAAITFIKGYGCKHIKLMVLVAAPEGIEHIQKLFPDVDIYAGAVDEKLNENGYIVPGLGDAGDRIFGTK